jgi:tRNA nucleotidyltransferase/poly(A) polymerase
MKKFLSIVVMLVAFSFLSVQAEEILSAKKAKEISKVATKKAIRNFLKNPKTKTAYEELRNFTAKRIKNVAEEGLYDSARIFINNVNQRKLKFNKLKKKDKDIAKYLLEKELKSKGYKIIKGEYDLIGIDWWVTWQ